ncbi:MAG: glycoside hydrolase family 16 protein [Armatimonadetes bacterium]|nr:glycoside hydrolase family 16 protein [Armatimonadota bacterium]
MAPPPVLPAWVGKQPPVAGNWTETFRDEFDAPTLDLGRWTVPDKDWASWWGNSSINSARNVLVENGLMKLRAEAGIRPEHAADPKMKDRKYVTGVVTTLDKFRQRYGYFEARVKMPKAMGLWPAFWMMPDRGPGAKDRQSTHQGGNELDIWESLVRFGPYRYNIAVHWDGYGKEHQSIGTERIYAQPDADGWLVTGLLWEPGKLTWYANGQAVGVWANERVATVPGYLMFTLPTGGWGTNGLADDAALPDTLDIDWVRCWQNLEWSQP